MVDTWAVPGNPVPISTYNPAPTGSEVQYGGNIFANIRDAVGAAIPGIVGGAINNAFGPQNQMGVTGGTGGADLSGVDITAPSATLLDTSNPFYQVSGAYVPGQIAAATNIYNQGRPDLNPIQQQFYDQVSPAAMQQANLANQSAALTGQALAGGDEYTQMLAERAANAQAAQFAGAGTLGSARAQLAQNRAAQDAALQGQRLAQAQVRQDQAAIQAPLALQQQAGQAYQDWQNTADWDWLRNYQTATGFGQHVPTSQTQVNKPSGAQIYSALLGQQLYNLGAGGIGINQIGNQPGQIGAPVQQNPGNLLGNALGNVAGNWLGNQIGGQYGGQIGNALGGGIGGAIGNAIGGWF